MACGKPILAADSRALPELVKPGVNGYLFRACDPEDASQAMERILDQPECWAVMGQASIAEVQNHTLENTINNFEEYYRKIMEGIPARRRRPTTTQRIWNKSI
jgi:glycosyltransferase involved in cell wall biosynthesis